MYIRAAQWGAWNLDITFFCSSPIIIRMSILVRLSLICIYHNKVRVQWHKILTYLWWKFLSRHDTSTDPLNIFFFFFCFFLFLLFFFFFLISHDALKSNRLCRSRHSEWDSQWLECPVTGISHIWATLRRQRRGAFAYCDLLVTISQIMVITGI